MTESRELLRELVACCDAAKDDGFLVDPDPLIERTQAAWQAARAHLSAVKAPQAPMCIWEDCDQEALYCAGHAREFVDPTNRLAPSAQAESAAPAPADGLVARLRRYTSDSRAGHPIPEDAVLLSMMDEAAAALAERAPQAGPTRMTKDDVRFVNELWAATPGEHARVGFQRAFAAGLARGIARAAAERAPRAEPTREPTELTFTLPGAKNLVEAFGGVEDPEVEIVVRKMQRGAIRDEDGKEQDSEAGLYAHFADYPEEGCFYLGDAAPTAGDEALPAPADDDDAVERLRAELRGFVIESAGFDTWTGYDYTRCQCCSCTWPTGDAEDHTDGCLAALPEDTP